MSAPTAAADDRAFFGHPRGLSTLWFTEMWERFSFYGMRALLILFMTTPLAAGGLGFDTANAGVVYAMYTSLVYLVALPGGWLADRFLGMRRSVLWGGLVIMLGHVCIAVPSLATFYGGLVLVIIGTGLLKPNVSAMVGQLYAPDDQRRDAGFSIYYMGINTGGFVAPLVCGWLAQSASFRTVLAGWGIAPESAWHFGFGAAAVGMAAGVTQYVLGARGLGEAGRHPTPAASPEAAAADRRLLRLGLGACALLAIVVLVLAATGGLTLSKETVNRGYAVFLTAVVVGMIGWMFAGGSWTREERRRLVVIAVLFLGATVFWSVFEQAGSTLNLFAERTTDNRLFGLPFPSSWFQSINSFFIIALSPAFGWLWLKLGRHDPSSPVKFTISLALVSASFFLLMTGSQLARDGSRVSPLWLLGAYFLQTSGEICLSPVGMSAMTRLAPARVQALMMGFWFLALSVGNYLGGMVASRYESFSLPVLFGAVGGYALVFAVVIGVLVRPIARMLARAG